MTIIKQADRWLTMETPLGEDVLILTGIDGVEEMSRLFSYRLDVVSRNDRIGPAELLGKNVTFYVRRAGGERRAFNGMVKRFSPGGMWSRNYRSYQCEVVPWLWFLTRTADLRIFQNKSAVDIIEQIFNDLGFKDFDRSGVATRPRREYCVQYRETDFDFVSRLMEEEGIFYFFTHESGRHKMVLADKVSAYVTCGDSAVEFRRNRDIQNHVHEWEAQYEFRSGRWAQTDYNFETPTTPLMTTEATKLKDVSLSRGLEVYEYPGRYANKGDGQKLTLYRMEAHEAEHHLVEGAGDCRTFTPGAKFSLTKHDCASELGEYVLTSVRHTATDYTYLSEEGGAPEYSNRFRCVPASVLFRPVPVTPKPVVHGPHTALVVGRSGEEIDCDEYGRVKVQFHWDREGRKDEKSSCWVRCAQSWAGRQWGTIHIPRIGMEVVVEFLEGDPDRPLITGAVYNAVNMPPYGLPGNKTQSGIKSRSSKGGGDGNFNELRMEDKKGSEEIYFHAEKDFRRIVENDDELKVGRHQTNTIEQNRTEKITKGNDSLTIEKGNRKIEVSLGHSYLEAMQKIEMKVGQNSIVIDQKGITIKGLMIKIEGSIMCETKAPMTQVKGDAMLILKGGLTLIN